MTEIQRFTTEYMDVEDRIRLAGEVHASEPVVLWLTQRLLLRLLPHLLDWLEQQSSADVRGVLVQGFAQQAALAHIKPQAPVSVRPIDTVWLVRAVDVTRSPDRLGLDFKLNPVAGSATAPALQPQLNFSAHTLRQWLGIIHQQYLRAQWPSHFWPDWLTEAQAARVEEKRVLH